MRWLNKTIEFPPLTEANPEGLLAVGGDLSPEDDLPTPVPGDTTGDLTVPVTAVNGGDTDGVVGDIDDPNNIITIDDFTPEQDPNKCS